MGSAEVAATLAGVTALTVTLNIAVACRLLGIGPRALVSSLATAVPGSLVMTAALVGWNAITGSLAPVAQAFGGVALGLSVYLGAQALTVPSSVRRGLRSLLGRPATRLAGADPSAAEVRAR